MTLPTKQVQELQELKARLTEYEAYKARETRFSNKEEFLDFCSKHFVYYPEGFGAYIQTLVETEQQFIDFVQKCCIEDWYEGSGGLIWFNNDEEQFHKYFEEIVEDKNILESACSSDYEDNDEHIVLLSESYRVDYNGFFDKPFCVVKDNPEYTKKVFKQNVLKVKPWVKVKMPFVARFVSMNSFDRLGSLEGCMLDIISLSEVKAGEVMFT